MAGLLSMNAQQRPSLLSHSYTCLHLEPALSAVWCFSTLVKGTTVTLGSSKHIHLSVQMC